MKTREAGEDHPRRPPSPYRTFTHPFPSHHHCNRSVLTLHTSPTSPNPFSISTIQNPPQHRTNLPNTLLPYNVHTTQMRLLIPHPL